MYISFFRWSLLIGTCLTRSAFVHGDDIFDMFPTIKDQVPTQVKEPFPQAVSHQNPESTCTANFAMEYQTVLSAYRHLIRDWLEKFPSKSAGNYRLFLELTSGEIQRLEQFAKSVSSEQKTALQEVHTISDLLKRVVRTIELDTPFESNQSWSIWLRSFDINLVIKSALLVLTAVAISFISIRAHLQRGRWISSFFIMAFVVSVMQNWYTLYLEAQAKVDQVLMKQLPAKCRGHSMGLFETIKSTLGRFVQLPTDECLEHHKALRATPFSQVTLVQAFSMTFAQLFVTPLGAIGESLSQFFAGTLRHVPIVLWPVVMIIIICVFIVVALMYSRYEVNLPFMMGSLRPSANSAAIDTRKEVVHQLENRIQQLETQLKEQKQTLALENKSASPPPPGFRAEFIE